MPDTKADLEVREAGPGSVAQPPVGELPAGGALWPVQHHLSKIGLINQIARAYRWTYDEALRNSRSNAVAMLRDTEIRDALETRFIPTTQLAWHLEAQDETDPEQMKAVQKLESVLRTTPRLTDLHRSLLWAIWYGHAGAQLLWEWDYSHPDGEKRLKVKNHRPLNGDSMVARWSGDWGLLVNGLYDGDKEPTDLGFAHFFTATEREAVLVHMHNPEDCDFREPELAGQIRGSGVRGHCYWYWWLAANFMALAEDYAERFANGIWKAYFDESNPNAKTEMENSLAGYRSSHVLMLPRNKATMAAVNDVSITEVGTASPQFLFELVQYLRNIIRKYITGSNINAETDIGMGGDAVGIDADRVARIVKYDAERLAETYNVDLMPVLCRYNCGPSVPPPRWVFDVDVPAADNIFGFAEKLVNTFGSTVDVDHLHKISGVPAGSPGSTLASKLQPMSPVAAAQTPQNVPFSGSPGPEPEGQPQPAPATAQPATPVDNQNSVGV